MAGVDLYLPLPTHHHGTLFDSFAFMKHHPFGPSRQKSLSICPGHLPTKNESEVAKMGTVCHSIWETGDTSLADQLWEPEEALKWISDLNAVWDLTLENFVGEFGSVTPVLNEITLDSPGINFGTVDKLAVTIQGDAALLGDAKFGAWSVDHADTNEQGKNYAVLVWDTMPSVDNIWVFFGNPRLAQYTIAKFNRAEHYQPFREELRDRLERATNADTSTFRFDPVNCSFCARTECPVRLAVVEEIVKSHPNVSTMDIQELADLKRKSNVFKGLAKQIDDEAKRRMLEDGEEIPGYEIVEKVRSREVIGINNYITLAKEILDLGIGSIPIADVLSISFSDVEQLVLDKYPGKEGKQLIKQLTESLIAVGALTVNSYFALAAKKN